MKRIVELSAKHPMEDGVFDLAPVASALGKAGKNILALTAAASSEGRMMNIRIFVENPAAASDALNSARIETSQTEALSFKVVNQEGALTQVTAALGPANTSIQAMTAAASSAGRMLNVFMLVSNPARAMDAFEAKIVH